MASIMQGTTPTITITIDTDDFLVSDVTEIDYCIKNGDRVCSYTLDDLTVDTENNAFIKDLTETETSLFDHTKSVVVQFRVTLPGGDIIGINPIRFSVADFIGV